MVEGTGNVVGHQIRRDIIKSPFCACLCACIGKLFRYGGINGEMKGMYLVG